MKMLMKRLFTVLMLVLPLSLQAQMQFGYMSYKTVMAEMPEYAQAKQSMAELKAKYDAEATRGEEEFQKKFVDFLQGQKDFPQTIMQKRQVRCARPCSQRSVIHPKKRVPRMPKISNTATVQPA